MTFLSSHKSLPLSFEMDTQGSPVYMVANWAVRVLLGYSLYMILLASLGPYTILANIRIAMPCHAFSLWIDEQNEFPLTLLAVTVPGQ